MRFPVIYTRKLPKTWSLGTFFSNIKSRRVSIIPCLLAARMQACDWSPAKLKIWKVDLVKQRLGMVRIHPLLCCHNKELQPWCPEQIASARPWLRFLFVPRSELPWCLPVFQTWYFELHLITFLNSIQLTPFFLTWDPVKFY